MKKIWKKPSLQNIDKHSITTGGPTTRTAAEYYVNTGSGSTFPCQTCETAGGQVYFTTPYWFYGNAGTGFQPALCNQAGGSGTCQPSAIGVVGGPVNSCIIGNCS